MNLDAFYQLLKSNDIVNIQIAWQFARSKRKEGDPFFSDFVKAVYKWSNIDFQRKKPVHFLYNLSNGILKLHLLKIDKVHDISYALSSLVNEIHIIEIQTSTFPKGFEVFENVFLLKFGSRTSIKLADELKDMKSLKTVVFEGFYDEKITKEFSILPEFINCSQIEHFKYFSRGKIKFPDNIFEMKNLKSISLACPGIRGPIWECKSLKELNIYYGNDKYSKSDYDAIEEAFYGNYQLDFLESLTINVPYLTESIDRIINNYIYLLTNLKKLSLTVYNPSTYTISIKKELNNLKQLEHLYLNKIDTACLKIIAQHPNLKYIDGIFSKYVELEEVYEVFKKYDSKASLHFDDLPL